MAWFIAGVAVGALLMAAGGLGWMYWTVFREEERHPTREDYLVDTRAAERRVFDSLKR